MTTLSGNLSFVHLQICADNEDQLALFHKRCLDCVHVDFLVSEVSIRVVLFVAALIPVVLLGIVAVAEE